MSTQLKTTRRAVRVPRRQPTVWVGNWNDDSLEIRDLVRDLKAAGIRARSDYSPYVGMHCLKVAIEDVAAAKQHLRDYGGAHGDYIADECLN